MRCLFFQAFVAWRKNRAKLKSVALAIFLPDDGLHTCSEEREKSPIKPENPKDEAADSQSVGFKFELVTSL